MLLREPIVSIITPVFNRANIINKAIESVIAQTYQNWELLLVDDGSTDNIGEIMATKYGGESRISYIRRNREPKGASTCRNIGTEHARGDYLIFLDSDDLLEPFCLEQRVEVMTANPFLDFAVFPLKVLMPNGNYLSKNFDNRKDPLINFLSKKSYWAIMSPIWKRQFFSVIGGFNDRFPRYQDIEIHIRALTQKGVKYKLCSDYRPDTEVIPSTKNDTVDFAMRLYASLHLLLPQTTSSLAKAKKTAFIKYMSEYLKDWLRWFARTNFDGNIADKTYEILILFRNHKVISDFTMHAYKIQIKVATFCVKLIKYIYIKLLH